MISAQGLVPNSNELSLPCFLAIFFIASRLTIPRSPACELYRLNHSVMNFPTVGFVLYTAELLARALCGAVSHHGPLFALRMRSSSRSLRLIIADLRTPPDTTISPILHIISWHSRVVSFLPAAPLNVLTTNQKSSTSGLGPDARPPNVFSLAPGGRIPDTSQVGTSPA
ncbi:hypothetical protein ATCV1_z842R [Acanthocystis turfacea chlorella virus 1]|uniref:Uncharacterized protein z842R n=1 Tax=Chlorovirus heliozoae TaxID=322019 RepID=A7KAA2_9PHYC|nr:hypothetical protein ATCV1_z842R [Acanthocystis turfacea chlorella virus 1]ABT16976.1 hypothetical protein ATCV1_z842R [Acanthocystis turfacea chlorella virus 1]